VLTDFNFDLRDDDSLKAFAGNTLHALFTQENQGLLPTKVNHHDAGLQLRYYQMPSLSIPDVATQCRSASTSLPIQRLLQWQETMSTLQHRQAVRPVFYCNKPFERICAELTSFVNVCPESCSDGVM